MSNVAVPPSSNLIWKLSSNTITRYSIPTEDKPISSTKRVCSVLASNSTVKSPTFALVNEYKCTSGALGVKKICHFDMYRVTDEDDLYSIGYDDYLTKNNICIAEWCELIEYALPEERIEVKIEKTEEIEKRSITINLIL